MKVLFVNTSDHTGGAAIAAQRLLKALQGQGVEAKMLCRDRVLPDERADMIYLQPSVRLKLKFILERLEIMLRNRFSRENLFAIDTARYGNDITSLPEFKEADIVHLHWTNQAMLSMKDLQKILQSGKHIVWTMHDMWPFTGICHHADLCTRWTEHCDNCRLMKHPGNKDLSFQTFRKKQKVYATGKIDFVACSNWLRDLAVQSPLLRQQRVCSIPNPIDTTFYTPAGSENTPTVNEIRHELKLPTDKLLLLFTAYKVTDPNKGIDYLTESLTLLCEEHPELRHKIALVLTGRESDAVSRDFKIPVYPMGYIHDEKQMRRIYQAANLLLMPTLMDNLPNTIIEAMACGTPCVGFRIGGLPQMIDNETNGYLAEYRNSLDFAHGIAQLLTSPSYQAICRNARSKAVQSYSEKSVAERFLALYRS